jgi:adenosine deaminase
MVTTGHVDIKALPKAELHCHLDGVLDRAMAWDIHRHDPTFPVDPLEFERAYPVEDFDSFWNWFSFVKPIYGELAFLYPILDRHIERLKAQSVRYSEVMIAASTLAQDQAEAIDQLKNLREWTHRKESGDIQIEFLVGLGRNRPPDVMAERAERVIALYEAGLIVGVALAGPEQGHPVKPFRKSFARFHEAGLKIEIHAGEWCGPESVWDALEYGYPDRIGHGVSLFQEARLLDLIRERDIHIELCPTSNLKTGSVSRIEEHPVGRARELGLNFSVNTDDPGPFECSMESEYELLARVFGFDGQDFEQLYARTLEARFQPVLRLGH